MFRALLLALAVTLLSFGGEARAGPGVEAYAGLPAVENVVVSHDGSTLAYIRRETGAAAKIIVQTRAGEVLAAVDAGEQRLYGIDWVSPDHIAIAWRTTGQARFSRSRGDLQVIDLLNVRTRSIARALRQSDHSVFETVFDWTPGVYHGQPVIYTEAVTDENGDYTLDLYRVDLETGRGILSDHGAGDTRSFLVDRDGGAAGRVAYQSENGLWRLSTRTGTGWREIFKVNALLDTPKLYGFGRTLDTVVVKTEEEGRAVLTEMSLADGSQSDRMVFDEVPDRVWRSPTGAMVGVGFATANRQRIFDPVLDQQWAAFRDALPQRTLSLVTFSDDYSVLVAYGEGAGESGAYYVYDAKAGRISIVGRQYPGVRGADVAQVTTVHYKAADGLDLIGYLTLPPGRDPHGLPVVVLPHGGPQSRDYDGFDWLPQAIASRGYAVFQPQFRGSDGFGDALLEAGYGEWGRKMQSDISDGLKAIAAEGTVDAGRACIFGWSYGGYAALAGMTLEPGTYRCAVSVAGVSDLREMLLSEQRQGAMGDRNPTIRYWKRFMGAADPSDRTLDERSPARLASRVQGPILLIHGRGDVVVPFTQSEMMLRALGGEGPNAHLIALPGEDHQLSGSAANRLTMLSAAITFLEANNPPN